MNKRDQEKYLTTVKGKLFIDKAYLLQKLGISEAEIVDTGIQNRGFDTDQLRAKDRQIERLQDQAAHLLGELTKKDEDLKSAWNIISRLQNEVAELGTKVKLLSAPETNREGDKGDRLQTWILIVLVVMILALVLWLIF